MPSAERAKLIQTHLSFLHGVRTIQLQLHFIDLCIVFHQFSHYHVPGKIDVLFLLRVFGTPHRLIRRHV